MATKKGTYTLIMDQPPSVAAWGSVGSKMEGEGPLADQFDILNEDTSFGEKTWEKAESQMQKQALNKAMEKLAITSDDIQYLFAGDLLNQSISSTFAHREASIPFIGLFGACSTMALSLGLSACFVETGLAQRCAAVTSSHFCTAERQFRFPLEYGGQRTPTSQWTATASGAVIVEQGERSPYVRAVTFGTIEDLKITDMNNMGAAMAPAAAKTIQHFFEDTATNASHYDLILTGDLGQVGSELLCELIAQEGYSLEERHNDCGLLIYDRQTQDVAAGGSGCGCSASVLCAHILPQMQSGRLRDVLFIATGALMSPTSSQQGESIPGIAHLIHLSTQPQTQLFS